MTDTVRNIIGKRTTTSISLNGSNQVIHTANVGRCDIALAIAGTITALMMFVFTDSTNAICALAANCGIGNTPINLADMGGVMVCPLYSPFDVYTIVFTYTSGVLYAKTQDGSTLANCIFNFNSQLGFVPDSGGLDYKIDNISSAITGTAININNDTNITSGCLNISPITGCYQINSNQVLTIENTDYIPKTTTPQYGQSSGSDVSDTKFRGATFDITKPVKYSKILFRVNQPATTASTLRFSVYQRSGGKAANSSNPATLISTVSTGLASVGGSTDTNIILTPTGSNFLCPGVCYGMVNRDSGGGNVSVYCYTNQVYDIFNFITGAPLTFRTLITGSPGTFDPTDSTNVMYTGTNISPIFRLMN